MLFKIFNISILSGFKSYGVPRIYKHQSGSLKIGKNFIIINTIKNNPIGRNEKCMLVVREDASLIIGNNVGISGTTIVCQRSIVIEDYVKIGGNVCIYDTNFHSLHTIERNKELEDKNLIEKKGIIIEKNVFIGAHTTILKGVTIGKNSIIGACSVVSKDIPANEIWAGNPAKHIRKINVN